MYGPIPGVKSVDAPTKIVKKVEGQIKKRREKRRSRIVKPIKEKAKKVRRNDGS